MKTYNLTIIHPGMSRFDVTVIADGFYAQEGGYYFYHNVPESDEFMEDQRTKKETKCVYPINLTIIRSII